MEMSEVPSQAASGSRPVSVGHRATWRRRAEWAVWILLFTVVIGYRWPVIKGWAYRMTNSTPAAASFEWRRDFDAALVEARTTGRPLLVDFYADWCPPCITMKHDVWPDPEVGRLIAAGYVPVAVNVDLAPAIAGRYEVVGIPTVLVIDAEGRVLRTASFLSRGGLRAFLRGE